MRRKLIAGNWKMNGTRAALATLDALATAHPVPSVDILICPPFTLLIPAAARLAGKPVRIGAQDCHVAPAGAHTGDVSAGMIADTGATAVILGHSERRAAHGETSETVCSKVKAAHSAGLCAIVCVGETLAERTATATLDVIAGQLAESLPDSTGSANTVVAYEPVWAIGTGLVPTAAQIAEVHGFMRARLHARFGPDVSRGLRMVYGGSVKPDNAAGIFAIPDVDGALVGGASLKEKDFSPIINLLEAEAKAEEPSST